ncbi:MAG: tripartite tricarboxylate transporter substrate binding protein [Planctomycetota bacterium]|jgi:tripartite-type tricarboxylate transporter receptor subunit TctC|nr:tripartite tricarboxylate transporter substrate binding protein [Planctomycetota bacterium]
MKKIFALSLILALVWGLTVVQAGQYPARAIAITVPAAPGGASDMTTRIFTSQMEKILNVPFPVTNRPGASCSIGMEYVKNRAPDGYNLSYIPVESVMIRALGLTDLSSNDFNFIARAMTIPAALTVRKEAPWDTFDAFLAHAKANPGAIKIGNSGTGSIWHIAAAAIEGAAGVKFTHVPFEGGAPAVAALMGANIDAVTVSPSEVQSGVDSGEFKVLAVLGEKRSGVVPEVKTAIELGYDVKVLGWGAFAAPKGTPPEIMAILEKAAATAIDSDEVKKFFKERGFDHSYLNAADMTAFAKTQLAFYDDMIPKLGIVNK